MNPDMNGGGSAWSPEGESGVGNPFKSVEGAQSNVVSPEPLAESDPSQIVNDATPPVEQVVAVVDQVSQVSESSPEAYRGQKLVLAAREVATNLVEKASEKWLGYMDGSVTDKVKTAFAVVGGTLATLYTASTIEAARIMTPDSGTLWDGLMEVTKLQSWAMQTGLSAELKNIALHAWAAPGLAATLAVATGLSIASIHKARKSRESTSSQNNLNAVV